MARRIHILSEIGGWVLERSLAFKLDIVILDNYHIVLTDRAYHNFQASYGVVNRVDMSQEAVSR